MSARHLKFRLNRCARCRLRLKSYRVRITLSPEGQPERVYFFCLGCAANHAIPAINAAKEVFRNGQRTSCAM